MSDKSKYLSSTGFTDLLFNVVVGLAFLFILAFILMNPIAKTKDVESKSDFIIQLTWTDTSGDDIDLWVRDPLRNLVSFRNRGAGLMHLDRDDLGLSNDRIIKADGQYEYIIRNKEIVSLRGIIPGKYLVNVHVYNKKPDAEHKMGPSDIQVVLIKLNPYKEVAYAEFVGDQRGQEFTAFHFTLNSNGDVIEVDSTVEGIIGSGNAYYIEPAHVGDGPDTTGSSAQVPNFVVPESYRRFFQGDGIGGQ